jgi:hypothetical protein
VLPLDPSKTILEYRGLKSLRPDVYLTARNDFSFAVEIFVTRQTEDEKRKKINDLNIPAIEIDLSNFYIENKEKCRADVAFVRPNIDALISNLNLRQWLIEPRADQCGQLSFVDMPPSKPTADPGNPGCMLVLIPLMMASVITLIFVSSLR